MRFAKEFKEFAMKGNVVDLAVGVVVGVAFGRIVSSLVADVVMPPLGLLIGDVNFGNLAAQIGTNPAGEPVLLRYGQFFQTVFEFLIVALALFVLIKGINRLKRPPEVATAPAPAPSKTELLLEQIRDLLAKK